MRSVLTLVAASAITACASDAMPTEPTERIGAISQPILGTQSSAAGYPEAVADRGQQLLQRLLLGRHRLSARRPHRWTLHDLRRDDVDHHVDQRAVENRDVPLAFRRGIASPPLTRNNYDNAHDLRDLAVLVVDTPFQAIAPAVLSSAQVAVGTSIRAIGRSSVSAGAGLVMSDPAPLLNADGDFYYREYKTTRLTDGGDSGGPIFVAGSHQLVGTERVFRTNDNSDHWSQIFGATYDDVVGTISASGGYVFVNAPPDVAPRVTYTFSVQAGSAGSTRRHRHEQLRRHDRRDDRHVQGRHDAERHRRGADHRLERPHEGHID